MVCQSTANVTRERHPSSRGYLGMEQFLLTVRRNPQAREQLAVTPLTQTPADKVHVVCSVPLVGYLFTELLNRGLSKLYCSANVYRTALWNQPKI